MIFKDATGNFLIPLSCDVVVSFGEALENKDLTHPEIDFSGGFFSCDPSAFNTGVAYMRLVILYSLFEFKLLD